MQIRPFRFLSGLRVILPVMLVFFVNTYAQEKPYNLNPAHYLVTELQTKRVVMLGDWIHGNAMPYWTVTSTLNEWLSMIASHEDAPHHLVLVLEGDDSCIALLKKYISSGDVSSLIDLWLPEPTGTLERLEFYGNLRAICRRVDSVNRAGVRGQHVSLDILGGEAVAHGSPAWRESFKWDFEKGWHYFVAVRDSVNSAKIVKYLERNPHTKALIFYGNAHLMNGYVNKQQYFLRADSVNGGYYLAHYLKKAFGQDQVLSVNQVINPSSVLKGTALASIGHQDVFVRTDRIPVDSLLPSEAVAFKNFDAVILRYEMITPNHPMDLIFSRKVIESDISTLDSMQSDIPGFSAQRFIDISLESLHMLTGRTFSSPSDWSTWYKTNGYRGLARIESPGFEDQVRADYYKRYADISYTRELYSLGFGPGIMARSIVIPESKWNTAWNNVHFAIETLNAIGIYWIGYPDEREQAHEWLVGHLGVDFETPEAYLQWWRHQYRAAY